MLSQNLLYEILTICKSASCNYTEYKEFHNNVCLSASKLCNQ
jgi:hypothetical protein